MSFENLTHSKVGTVQFVMNADDLRLFADEIVTRVHQMNQSQTPEAEDELYTREKVMSYLGIKSTTLWQWAKMGVISPIKINRKCYYRKSDILALQSGKTHINNQLNKN